MRNKVFLSGQHIQVGFIIITIIVIQQTQLLQLHTVDLSSGPNKSSCKWMDNLVFPSN